MEYTPEQIQARFDSLPKELQEILSSVEINEEIQKIGEKHNLLIDQIGDLVEHVGLILLGLNQASRFVNDISAKLSISKQEAQAIADEINSDVFTSVRSNMRALEEKEEAAVHQQTVSSIEQAGDFNIVPEAKETGNNITAADKPKILSQLENPTAPVENREPKEGDETYKEPLVDQLLQGQTASTAKTVENTTPKAPVSKPPVQTPPPAPKRPQGPDQYREPV